MSKLNIAGETYDFCDYFGLNSSVPDCNVVGPNKLGDGHGEAKFYIGPKDKMREFYGGEGFDVKCIMLREDLLGYMDAIKNEYYDPSYPYGEAYQLKNKIKKKKALQVLWRERYNYVRSLPEVVSFRLKDQCQIKGPRGYVNSEDEYYNIFRELSLAESSYISACSLVSPKGNKVYYWKLFVDYSAMAEPDFTPYALKYGNGQELIALNKQVEEKKEEIRSSRIGQGKYREELLKQMHFCPITNISDDRLLIASHIKPWRSCDDEEKIDPYNGYLLSPMFDKLFDQGYITFTEDKKVHLSNVISQTNYKLINIKEGQYFQNLPMDDKRKSYLEFHRKNVFRDFVKFMSELPVIFPLEDGKGRKN